MLEGAGRFVEWGDLGEAPITGSPQGASAPDNTTIWFSHPCLHCQLGRCKIQGWGVSGFLCGFLGANYTVQERFFQALLGDKDPPPTYDSNIKAYIPPSLGGKVPKR